MKSPNLYRFSEFYTVSGIFLNRGLIMGRFWNSDFGFWI
ncbi:hypothetical protein D1AOALGA4SA_12699 [Olavius algarvensis Delta 1 endosymbiont]|nr:hypothetical protein D1AOALGA4SA_12699 [Olavius algarvensis Delta 1 endosymbiont]